MRFVENVRFGRRNIFGGFCQFEWYQKWLMNSVGLGDFVGRIEVRVVKSWFEEEEKEKQIELKGFWEFCGIGEFVLSKEF